MRHSRSGAIAGTDSGWDVIPRKGLTMISKKLKL